MDATTVTKELITKYFKAWINYDIDLLNEVFDSSAKYIIINKNAFLKVLMK